MILWLPYRLFLESHRHVQSYTRDYIYKEKLKKERERNEYYTMSLYKYETSKTKGENTKRAKKNHRTIHCSAAARFKCFFCFLLLDV